MGVEPYSFKSGLALSRNPTSKPDGPMAHTSDVILVEVGPRDGLQYEAGFFPTQGKIKLIDMLSQTGLTRIEATSFVHPKAVPQLADAAQVMKGITKRPGVVYSVLTPNLKGCQAALASPADELALFVSASETHNQKNVNQSVAESLAGLAEVARLGRAAGRRLRGYIVTAFGCPYEGRIPRKRLAAILDAYAGMGVAEVSLGDTTGMANPRQVSVVLERLVPRFPGIEWTLHTHDTRAMAIPNILAAMALGVTHFDASIGGLGGCPFAPGASGNVCTEDLVHCLHAMGVATGIDLDRLIATSRRVEQIIGRTLPGQLIKAGPSTRRYPLPDSVAGRLRAS